VPAEGITSSLARRDEGASLLCSLNGGCDPNQASTTVWAALVLSNVASEAVAMPQFDRDAALSNRRSGRQPAVPQRLACPRRSRLSAVAPWSSCPGFCPGVGRNLASLFSQHSLCQPPSAGPPSPLSPKSVAMGPAGPVRRDALTSGAPQISEAARSSSRPTRHTRATCTSQRSEFALQSTRSRFTSG
jgi:hypothetical protein